MQPPDAIISIVVEMSKHNPELNDLARLFKALSDPNRLAILQYLRECCGPGCCVSEDEAGKNVGEIAKRFDIVLSTVSHHIKELRTVGLVSCTKQGKQVRCSINQEALDRIEAFLEASKED